MPYWFLCTQFSRHPHGLEAAYKEACQTRALLIKAGVLVFSPICHSYGPAIEGDIDPHSHTIWLAAEAPFRRAAIPRTAAPPAFNKSLRGGMGIRITDGRGRLRGGYRNFQSALIETFFSG